MNSRPLLKTTHLLDVPPAYMSSLTQDNDIEWLFLNSRSPDASPAATAISWHHRDVDLAVPLMELEPQGRSSLQDTLYRLHCQGQGLDWSMQNRFKQNISGMVCAEEDQVLHSWLCTAAGDVFAQTMDLKDSHTMVSNSHSQWIEQWTSCVREIEQDSSVSVVATELYGTSHIVESISLFHSIFFFTILKFLFAAELSSKMDKTEEQELAEMCHRKPDMEEPECLAKFNQLTANPDERGKKYLDNWCAMECQLPDVTVSADNNLTQDFQMHLFTSTPFCRERKHSTTRYADDSV